MPLSFPKSANSAQVVGQVGNLRRVGNPPEPLVNWTLGAGCQPARRIPSCPTINAGRSVLGKLSGIGLQPANPSKARTLRTRSYSYRSASSGFTRDALRAGRYPAAIA